MFKQSRGFTLLEVLITIAIASILLAVAIPSFETQIKNSRLAASAHMLTGAYTFARSEAITRAVPITIKEITGGLVVVIASTDEELQRFEPNHTGITMTSIPDVTYDSSGFRQFGGSIITIKIIDSRSLGRNLIISASGAIKVEAFDESS